MLTLMIINGHAALGTPKMGGILLTDVLPIKIHKKTFFLKKEILPLQVNFLF